MQVKIKMMMRETYIFSTFNARKGLGHDALSLETMTEWLSHVRIILEEVVG